MQLKVKLMELIINMLRNFGFLIFDNFEDLDFMGPWEMITTWSKNFNGPESIFVISENGGIINSAKGLKINSDESFATCPKLDCILIPGGQGTRQEVNNNKIINFITTQCENCQQILSVCTGAFLLDAAGILKNNNSTTHWDSLERLEQTTQATVQPKRYTQDGNIWTSAGVSAGIDMALAFIAAICNENTAGDIQLLTEYYPDSKVYPNNQDYYPPYVIK